MRHTTTTPGQTRKTNPRRAAVPEAPKYEPVETEDEQSWDDTSWASGHFLSRRYRILVAEDDEDMRSLLVAELRRDGYDAQGITDGGELLDRLRQVMTGSRWIDRPDAIVTDLRMPGWSGIDVLDFVQQLGWKMPVILITAFGDARTHRLASSLGAAGVLDKPFSLGELRVAVYEALDAVETLRFGRTPTPRPVGTDW